MRVSHDPYLWLCLGLALVSLGGPLLVLGGYDLASQFLDDAFYYFQIAKNVAGGRGFTFDGLHETNGFHPLWLFSLVPIFGLLPGLDLPVRAVGLLEAALVGVASGGLYLGLKARIGRESATLAAFLLLAPGVRRIVRTGLEGALELCLLVAIWYVLLAPRERERDARPWASAGLLCALAVMARLEALGAVLVLALLQRERLSNDRWASFSLLGPPLACISGYVAWNWLAFDTWLPVSGMVKNAWAARQGYALPGGLEVSRSTPAVVLALGTAALILWLLRRREVAWLRPLREAGVPALALIAVSMLGAELVVTGGLPNWYRVPALPVLAVALAVVLQRRRRLVRGALVMLGLIALARVPYTVWATPRHEHQAGVRGRAANWLREHTPPGTRIGSWNGGMLGYYSGRPVIMLDGLANSAAYYRRVLIAGDLAGYLRDERIEFLATVSCAVPVPFAMHGKARVKALLESYERQGALTEERGIDPCTRMTLWRRRPG